MNHPATPFRSSASRLPRRGARPDYKQILAREAPFSPNTPSETLCAAEAPSPADQVRCLAQHADVASAAFQGLAAAALQALDHALYYECRAAEAAISLAQQEKINAMAEEIEAAAEALRPLIRPQSPQQPGRKEGKHAVEGPETSWWFALSEALYALEEGAGRTRSTIAGQAPESASRALSTLVAALLHAHYHAFLAEAEHWMA